MRVIKFQAVHKATGHRYIVSGLDFASTGICEMTLSDMHGYVVLNTRRIDEYTVLQFTGQHEKAGQEIYGGDKVRGTNGIGTVRWVGDGWRVQMDEGWIGLSEDIWEIVR